MADPVSDNGERRIITLIRGIMEQGGFYWCYLAVKPSLMEKFQDAVEKKYNIQNFVKDGYGEVIVSGRGRTPPKDITAKVAEMFKVSFIDLEGSDDVTMSIAKMISELPPPPAG